MTTRTQLQPLSFFLSPLSALWDSETPVGNLWLPFLERTDGRSSNDPRHSYSGPPIFEKLWRARSRLYRSRFLRPRYHFAAFFEIYKMYIPSHRSKLNFYCKISNEILLIFSKKSTVHIKFDVFRIGFDENSSEFQQFSENCEKYSRFHSFCRIRSRGVAKNGEIIFEKIRICRLREYPSHLRQCRGSYENDLPQP